MYNPYATYLILLLTRTTQAPQGDCWEDKDDVESI